MDPISAVSEELGQIDGQITDIFRVLSNGFQKLEKIKDVNRQSRQLEELTGKMRDCKRLIKDFDREVKDMESRNDPNTNRMLNEKKQSMVGLFFQTLEFNSLNLLPNYFVVPFYDSMPKFPKSRWHFNADQRVEFICGSKKAGKSFAAMSNQQLMDHGNQMMDETDQAIERGKKIVQETMDVGTETAAALKAQTEQMSRIVNELDSIHFSIKKASQLVKEIGRQVATDKCIMAMLVLIVIGVIAIIIVKLVNPNNKDIRDIPGLAPPAQSRRLLWNPN
ncbi:hypothetical protein GH714_041620 [Hevea brasiliensis]|uniref:t-SNARE coiled-coil homology domain-containing protein n=1 Tax=Hevea brasiliensis TaxID=3981 RepID=A0A6A6MWI1_HEVBR|nr:hypothetical protein GH714_041620 [Hevea brasiliensis]